ncbi:uncharacterized protein LOC133203382 [Saccostrea echinata]|uniref:uncharacterized protein LOC133203382 n=1 Tax=Saccostrea echinata TaxID=191078 RepID=UPI002A831C88|nr:uncharacterized protein LOC133203382 [Saccostrea echinata]
MFYGAGSASVGNPSESLGGIVYGYTESEILIWTPTSINSHLIYIDGVWGDGSDKLQEDRVQITVKIINTDISVKCAVLHYVTTYDDSCDQECAPPPDILNTVKVNNGLGRGSLTSYSCLAGFVSNGGLSVSSCNGTHWLETHLTCSLFTTVPNPPTIANADHLVSGNIAQYACRVGFYPDMGGNIILYYGTGWTTTKLECKASRISVGNTSVSSREEIICNLKISKRNTSSYDRSLRCAYDPRPSSLTIGSVGVAILCLVAALLFLADCHTFLQRKN